MSKNIFIDTPLKLWKAEQLIVFDWVDGAREGVLKLSHPNCNVFFKAIGERVDLTGLDSILYTWKPLPIDSFSQMLEILSVFGVPKSIYWVPNWEFKSEEEKARVNSAVNLIISRQSSKGLIVQTKDMINYKDFWLEC